MAAPKPKVRRRRLPTRKLFVTQQQILNDEALFSVSPYRIISRFLECFDRNGALEIAVPRYVLEELAKRFICVNCEELNSLDDAFGGRIARQRNAARKEERDWDILHEVFRLREKLRAMSPQERGVGTPTRHAIGQCAEAFGVKPGTVRRILYGKKMRGFAN